MPTSFAGHPSGAHSADLYKDKIEVSLDGRQIFYLFFGGAVIVGLVFVLGVMVGRRVEARGHVDRARTAAVTDPLAALDRLEGTKGLSFQGTLTGQPAQTEVERAIGEIEKTRDKPEPKAEPKVEPKVKAKPEAKPEAKIDKKPETKKPETKTETKSEAKSEAKTDAKSETKTEAKAEAKAAAKKEPKADGKETEGAITKPEQIDPPKRYTLQLSSFQDKAEAESYLKSLEAAGYQAHVTEAEVSGKGTFYRVRMGTYRSLEAANDAKAELEKSLKKSASVMRL